MTSAGTSKLTPLFRQRTCQMLRRELGPYVGALAFALASLCPEEGFCIHRASGQRKSPSCVSPRQGHGLWG